MIVKVTLSLKFMNIQASRTAHVLHKIANCDAYGLFDKQVMMLSQQMLHRLPEFSCGLFTFDLGLAFKVTQINDARNSLVYMKSKLSDDKRRIDLHDHFVTV